MNFSGFCTIQRASFILSDPRCIATLPPSNIIYLPQAFPESSSVLYAHTHEQSILLFLNVGLFAGCFSLRPAVASSLEEIREALQLHIAACSAFPEKERLAQ